MVASVLDGQIRQVQNIQICQLDLAPLLPKVKQRLPSMTINTFGVHLQQVLDADLECVLELDPKFDQVKATRIALAAEQNPDMFALTTLSVKEGSHRVCVAQAMKGEDKPKKIRQMRWQAVTNELSGIIPVKGSSHASHSTPYTF
jgi:hypothetical protein